MTPRLILERTGHRVAASLAARVIVAGTRQHEATIVNISAYGLRAHCDAPLRRGDRVTVVLPCIGAQKAKIAWCHDGYFGAVFVETIDIRHLAAGDTNPNWAPTHRNVRDRSARAPGLRWGSIE